MISTLNFNIASICGDYWPLEKEWEGHVLVSVFCSCKCILRSSVTSRLAVTIIIGIAWAQGLIGKKTRATISFMKATQILIHSASCTFIYRAHLARDDRAYNLHNVDAEIKVISIKSPTNRCQSEECLAGVFKLKHTMCC
jgi:hypothetical protein